MAERRFLEDDDPIEPQFHRLMNGLAHTLDEIFNGVAHRKGPKKNGFVLLTFEFGSDKRLNYISNADRDDVISLMKEFIARNEGRTPQVSGRKQ